MSLHLNNMGGFSNKGKLNGSLLFQKTSHLRV